MTVWQLHWGFKESDQYFVIYCLIFVIRMLRLLVMSICVVIMHIFFASPYYVVVFICGLDYEWVRSRFVYFFAHTHMHFHDINSMPEFGPFRRKC